MKKLVESHYPENIKYKGFCGENHIFDVSQEAYFAFLQISVITRQVSEIKLFIISSLEMLVFHLPFTCCIMHMRKFPCVLTIL